MKKNIFLEKDKLELSKSEKSIKFSDFGVNFKNGKKLLAKSMHSSKLLSNNQPIEVVPSEIFFHDIIIDQTYEIPVFIRNLTKTKRRIRILQPKSGKFRFLININKIILLLFNIFIILIKDVIMIC